MIDGPWQVAARDITDPFVKSKIGYEYILVFQDLFTRWVECIPVRKANAKTVLKEFNLHTAGITTLVAQNAYIP